MRQLATARMNAFSAGYAGLSPRTQAGERRSTRNAFELPPLSAYCLSLSSPEATMPWQRRGLRPEE
jgi:hypothetical protein